jgi:hypothetical protein
MTCEPGIVTKNLGRALAVVAGLVVLFVVQPAAAAPTDGASPASP